VSRYVDHQPLYRQAQIMARRGVVIDRSTYHPGWATRRRKSRPWWRVCVRSWRPQAGSSPMRRLCPCSIPAAERRSKAISGRSPVMIGPGAGGGDPPGVVYHYAPGRGHVHADAFARRLPRHRAMRRVWRLQGNHPGSDAVGIFRRRWRFPRVAHASARTGVHTAV
jgi:hypothetical protein